jgi:hypothetical protein
VTNPLPCTNNRVPTFHVPARSSTMDAAIGSVDEHPSTVLQAMPPVKWRVLLASSELRVTSREYAHSFNLTEYDETVGAPRMMAGALPTRLMWSGKAWHH